MIAKTYTCSLLGIDALLVEVEVDLSPGLPYFATIIDYLIGKATGVGEYPMQDPDWLHPLTYERSTTSRERNHIRYEWQ
jgi:hypothetical protein